MAEALPRASQLYYIPGRVAATSVRVALEISPYAQVCSLLMFGCLLLESNNHLLYAASAQHHQRCPLA